MDYVISVHPRSNVRFSALFLDQEEKGKLWKLLNKDEACLTIKFNNFPKVQVKDLIQSMVDVPIHQEDLAVQRTPLIDLAISMVTEKTASTPTPPTTQAHVQMCSTSCWKDISRGV
ncbi:hypothetical protein Tco_0473094 [Tanacetum coccineum]